MSRVANDELGPWESVLFLNTRALEPGFLFSLLVPFFDPDSERRFTQASCHRIGLSTGWWDSVIFCLQFCCKIGCLISTFVFLLFFCLHGMVPSSYHLHLHRSHMLSHCPSCVSIAVSRHSVDKWVQYIM